jgi:hypothetical protein
MAARSSACTSPTGPAAGNVTTTTPQLAILAATAGARPKEFKLWGDTARFFMVGIGLTIRRQHGKLCPEQA